MKKLVLAMVVAFGMLLGFDGPAGAQWAAPMGMGWGNPYQAPMDMSWAIQSQGMLQQYGDWAAMNAANTYLNYMNQIRNNGYTGPSLPTGVTPQSLHGSIEALNRQYSVNNQSAMGNAHTTSQAIGDFDQRAIRGCIPTYDAYGRPYYYYACP
jgi:hypothetical protein